MKTSIITIAILMPPVLRVHSKENGTSLSKKLDTQHNSYTYPPTDRQVVPVAKPTSTDLMDPIPEPRSEPTYPPTYGPTYRPTPRPIPQPTMQPAPQATSTDLMDPIPEPRSEPTPRPIPQPTMPPTMPPTIPPAPQANDNSAPLTEGKDTATEAANIRSELAGWVIAGQMGVGAIAAIISKCIFRDLNRI